jgi:hypothetical protein
MIIVRKPSVVDCNDALTLVRSRTDILGTCGDKVALGS